MKWNRSEILTLVSMFVAAIAAASAFFVPEIRQSLGLEPNSSGHMTTWLAVKPRTFLFRLSLIFVAMSVIARIFSIADGRSFGGHKISSRISEACSVVVLAVMIWMGTFVSTLIWFNFLAFILLVAGVNPDLINMNQRNGAFTVMADCVGIVSGGFTGILTPWQSSLYAENLKKD